MQPVQVVQIRMCFAVTAWHAGSVSVDSKHCQPTMPDCRLPEPVKHSRGAFNTAVVQ
jgi:hypothetical protein